MIDLFPHPSIERLFKRRLYEVIGDDPPRLPVYRSLHPDGILYRCPARYHFSEMRRSEIVERLRMALPEISLTPDGWWEWLLGDRDLARWLIDLDNSIGRLFPDAPPGEPDGEFRFLFRYTYARCVSLLDLLPAPYPPLPTFSHPLERAVLLQMLTLVDRNGTGNARSPAVPFCEALLHLDRGCRIIGEPPEIARSRLYLLSVSRRLLRGFLVGEFALLPGEEL